MRLPWLDGYGDQSTAELISLAKTHRVDSVVLAFEQALDAKAYRLGDAALSKQERVVLAVEAMESQVNNGGVHQFLVNSSKEYAPLLVEALEEIRAPATAAIMREWFSIVGLPPGFTAAQIDAALSAHHRDALLEASEPLNQRYFDSGEDIAGLLFAYIRSNAEHIHIP